MTQHAPEESARVAKRIPSQDRQPVTAPDPGEGWRLVDVESDAVDSRAQLWLPCGKRWAGPYPREEYLADAYYRVPIDQPRVPPIPTSEDPCPWFNEPDRGPDVVAWIMAAVMAAVLLLTGFLIGWSL